MTQESTSAPATTDKLPPATSLAPMKFLQLPSVQKKFTEILGSRGNAFVSSIITLIGQSEKLKNCPSESVYMAAMMAATLDLPINPALGFAYIIPYYNNDLKCDVATFQIGYKSYIQLAQRTGVFKSISAAPIYEGQLIAENPLEGFEFDFKVPAVGEPIGYASYFKLLNGFEKTFYMTKKELDAHAKRYSKTYGFKTGRWTVDFESMALKTVLKLLLSKYAPLSVEMQLQKAIEADQGVIKLDGTVEYPDNNSENFIQIGKGQNSTDHLMGKLADTPQATPEPEPETPEEVALKENPAAPVANKKIGAEWGSYAYEFTGEDGSATVEDIGKKQVPMLGGDIASPTQKVGTFCIGLGYFKEQKLLIPEFKKIGWEPVAK